MKNKNLILGVALAMSLMFTGCSKKEDAQPTPTNTEKLCGKNWKEIKWEKSSDGINFVTQYHPSCEMDDIISFNSNGTTISNSGAIKCDINDHQTYSDTWAWAPEEVGIYLGEGAYKKYATIIKNDGSSLVILTNNYWESKSGYDDSLVVQKHTYSK